MSEQTPAQHEATVALLGKLHEVANAIDYIEKNGRNDHHKYDFAQAVDVVRPVREELLKRGILVIPRAHPPQGQGMHQPFGSKGGIITTVELGYHFTDTTTGAFIDVPWIGVGADTGGDKGVYKAYTGGLKYALLSLFLIPTTNDPERDQLTEQPSAPEPEEHKDDARPAAPRIPTDRAHSILARAIEVSLASREGEEVKLTPTFQALLLSVGCPEGRIGLLNVDQAEDVEQFLAAEPQ